MTSVSPRQNDGAQIQSFCCCGFRRDGLLIFPKVSKPFRRNGHFSSFPALPRSWKCVFYYGFPDIGQRSEHFVETGCLVFPSMCFPSTPFAYFSFKVSSPLFVALSTGCLGPSWGLLGPVLGHLGGRVGPLPSWGRTPPLQHPARSNTIGSPKASIELARSGLLGL